MSGGWIQASVSMPCTARIQSRCRTGAGAAGTGASGVRPTASTHARHRRCSSLEARGRRAGARRHVGPEPRQRRRLLENPRELAARRDRNAMEHDGPPEIETGSDARDIDGAPRAKLLDEQRLDIPGENASRREFLSIPRLGEERLAAELIGGALDGLFERQVLEGVQRVVVDEDADGPLRGQQVRQVIDDARQRIVVLRT